jgi:hypothetical protein
MSKRQQPPPSVDRTATGAMNAKHLQRSEFEKFEAQPYRTGPPVRIQTQPRARWLKWLLR